MFHMLQNTHVISFFDCWRHDQSTQSIWVLVVLDIYFLFFWTSDRVSSLFSLDFRLDFHQYDTQPPCFFKFDINQCQKTLCALINSHFNINKFLFQINRPILKITKEYLFFGFVGNVRFSTWIHSAYLTRKSVENTDNPYK